MKEKVSSRGSILQSASPAVKRAHLLDILAAVLLLAVLPADAQADIKILCPGGKVRKGKR